MEGWPDHPCFACLCSCRRLYTAGSHGYLLCAEDGESTVMLRADAGSAAEGFVGAPVLQEDSTRCALTSR